MDCITRVQAAVRGIKCRQELVQQHREINAKKSGVLYAIGKTVQGTEGWYQNSEDSVLYFIIEENGNWKNIAGPIHRKLYDILVKPPLVKGNPLHTYVRTCSSTNRYN